MKNLNEGNPLKDKEIGMNGNDKGRRHSVRKRLTCVLLSMVLALGLVPSAAFATASDASPQDDTITVSIRVIGSSLPDSKIPNWNRNDSSFDFKGAEYENWLATESYTVAAGTTYEQLAEKALTANNLSYAVSSQGYINSVTGPDGSTTLAEKSGVKDYKNGTTYSVWCFYLVGSENTDSGAVDAQASENYSNTLSDGDAIILHWSWDRRFECLSDTRYNKSIKGDYLDVPDMSQAEADAAAACVDLIDAIGRVTRESVDAITAARNAYDALTDRAKTGVTNYETLTTAEATYASIKDANVTTLSAPTLATSGHTVGYDTVTLAAPAASEEDAGATVQYRTSLDGSRWSVWQDSATFENLLPNTVHKFQARYMTSDLMTWDDSAASAAIELTPAATSQTTVEVSDFTSFANALSGAATDGTETIVKLTQDIYLIQETGGVTPSGYNAAVPSGAIVTITGPGSFSNEYGNMNCGFQVSSGATVTLKDVEMVSMCRSGCTLMAANHWNSIFKLADSTAKLNLDNANLSGNTGSALIQGSGTMNIYSGSVFKIGLSVKDALLPSIISTTTLNIIPNGDIAVEGSNSLPASASVNPLYKDLTSASTRNAAGTAYNELAVATLNRGASTLDLSKASGFRLNTAEGAAAIPTAFEAPVLAEEGSEGAEDADIVYKREDDKITFTVQKIPTSASLESKGWRYTGYWDTGADDMTGYAQVGDTLTKSGLSQDTEYTFSFKWCAIGAGYSDSKATEVKIFTTFTQQQLDSPTLSDDITKTATSVTLKAVDASSQQSDATAQYRVSSDSGATWGDWQESTEFTGLEPYTDYMFQARYVGAQDSHGHYLWTDSEPSTSLSVTTSVFELSAPVISDSNVTVTEDSITVSVPDCTELATATTKYRISSDGETWGEWQESGAFSGLNGGMPYYLQAIYESPAGNVAYVDSAESNTYETRTTLDDSKAYFYVTSATIDSVSDEATVTVGLANNPGIVNVKFNVNYDSDKMELSAVSDAELMPNYAHSSSFATEPYMMYWEDSTSTTNLTVNGSLATLTFKMRDACQPGDEMTVRITYSSNDVYGVDFTNVFFQTVDGTISVKKLSQDAPAAGDGFTVDYEAETAAAREGYELSLDGETWLASGVSTNVTPGGAVKVRLAETSTKYTSPATDNVLDARPASGGTLDVKTEQFVIQPGSEYSQDGGETWEQVSGSEATTISAPSGTSIRVRKPATSSSFASDVETLTAPERASIPQGLQPVNETVNGASDGQVEGLVSGTTYEYSTDGGSNWTEFTATDDADAISDLADGYVQVRIAATSGDGAKYASDAVTLVIGKGAENTYMLNTSNVDFGEVTLDANDGYTQPAAMDVTFSNGGNTAVTITKVELGGENADSFTLTGAPTGETTVAVKGSTSGIKVQPNGNLAAGLHIASVIATYKAPTATDADATAEAKAYVYFIVNAHPVAALYDAGGYLVRNYASLQAAIDAAYPSETIKLLEDITGGVTVSADDDFTLDLNGHNITATDGSAIINSGKLTITGEGTVSTTASGSAAVGNTPGATCELAGGTYESSSWYVVKNLGTMSITGDNVTVKKPDGSTDTSSLIDNGWYGNKGNDSLGGTDYSASEYYNASSSATLTISSGTFTGKSGSKSCSVVKNDDYGTLVISGGTFDSTANTAANDATTILNWNAATISGGTFKGSYPLSNGYLSDTADKGELTITGGTFEGTTNVLGVNGGAKDGGFVNVTGGTFKTTTDDGSDFSTGSYPYDINVSGGEFTNIVPVANLADGYVATTEKNNNDMYTVVEGEYVATVSDSSKNVIGYYTTVQDAVDAATDGQIVTLLVDVTLAATEGSYIKVTKGITLDLGGHTVTRQDASTGSTGVTVGILVNGASGVIVENGTVETEVPFYISGDDADVTLENVTAKASDTGVTVYGGEVTIKDSNISCTGDDNYAAIMVSNGAKATLEGGTVVSDEYGVAVSGSNDESNPTEFVMNGGTITGTVYGITGTFTDGKTDNYTTITISGGTVSATDAQSVAIYHSQEGTLALNGGTITGATGVQMCSGTLDVPADSTVEVTATGADYRDKYTGAGTGGGISDGAAISVVKRTYATGITGGSSEPKVEIGDGETAAFAAAGNDAIIAYAWDDSTSTQSEWDADDNINIAGQYFNSKVPEGFCKDGYGPTEADGYGMYTVELKASAPSFGDAVSIDYEEEVVTARDGYEIAEVTTNGDVSTIGEWRTGSIIVIPGETQIVVRRAATSDAAASAATAPQKADDRPAAPQLTLDNTAETVTIPVGYQYWDDSNSEWVDVVEETEMTVAPGAKLDVRTQGSNTDKKFASEEQTIEAPERGATPTGLSPANETYSGEKDGKITGLDADVAYQYMAVGGTEWIDAAEGATEITGLADGAYLVRMAPVAAEGADLGAYASTPVTITVGQGVEKTIALTVVVPTFDEVETGYALPEPGMVQIVNGGNAEATFSVALTGDGANKFTLVGTATTVAAGATESGYTICPTDKLTAGVYMADIEVSYTDGAGKAQTAKATVVFIVTDPEKLDSIDAIASQTYTGSAITPAVTVRDAQGNKLIEGTDYELAYSKNVDAGSATVTATGVAGTEYAGQSATASFVIDPAKISGATIGAIPDQTWTGSAITPELVVKVGDTTLEADKDYIVSYANNASVGIATAIVVGQGNYTGMKSTTFTILAAEQTAPAAGEGFTVDYAAETVAAKDGYEISTDEGKTWKSSADGAQATAPGATVSVRKAADGGRSASAATANTLAARPATPAAPVVDTAKESAAVAGGLEYSTDGGKTWRSAGDDGAEVALKPGAGLDVRQPATASSFASEAASVTAPSKAAAPSGLTSTDETVYGAADGTISGLAAGMQYRKAGDSEWTDIAAGDLTGGTLTGLSAGSYQVRYAASESAYASDAVGVTIGSGANRTYTLSVSAPSFDSVPYGYGEVAAKSLSITNSGNSDATISLVKTDSADFVVEGSGATVKAGQTLETYTVRPATGLGVGVYSATVTVTYNDGAAASAAVSLEVTKASQAAPAEGEGLSVDYAAETVAALVGFEISTDGGATWKSSADGAQATAPGATVQVRKAATDTAEASPAASATLPSRAAAPTGLATSAVSSEGASDGAITGLDAATAYEYRAVGDDAWVAVEAGASSIGGLEPGNYEVRAAATASSFAGDSATVTVDDVQYKIKRLAGSNALGTMQAINREGVASGASENVIVATLDGYWDALAASGLAGLADSPILMTDGDSLSAETAAEIQRIGASNVYVVGGTSAVSEGVATQLSGIDCVQSVRRIAGDNAVKTAVEVYEEGSGSWGGTAIIASSDGYHDALAASPYSYAKGAPIFLADAGGASLSDDVLQALREGGFTRVVIVGGEVAIAPAVASQVSGLGISVQRYWGDNAYETSVAIASWCLDEGMSAANVGVACGTGYYDALSAAAFCGANNSPIVLCDDSNGYAVQNFVAKVKGDVETAYVFGGEAAVGSTTYNAIEEALE